MKITLVFLLLAVSASYGRVMQPWVSTVPACIQKILKTDIQSMLSGVQKLFCTYDNCKKDAGCTVDWIFFHDEPTAVIISDAVGKGLRIIHDAIQDLKAKFQVEEPVFDELCNVLNQVPGAQN